MPSRRCLICTPSDLPPPRARAYSLSEDRGRSTHIARNGRLLLGRRDRNDQFRLLARPVHLKLTRPRIDRQDPGAAGWGAAAPGRKFAAPWVVFFQDASHGPRKLGVAANLEWGMGSIKRLELGD